MKKTRVFLLLLGCGFAGIFATVSVNETAPVEAQELEPIGPTTKVFVAGIGLDPGEQVQLRNINIAERPVAEVPANAATDLDSIAALFAKGRIESGTIFSGDLLVDDKELSQPLVPDGFRSTTISAYIDPTISDSLEPGLAIDVIALLHDTEERTVSARRILKGINLLAKPELSNREDRHFSLPVLTKDDDAEMLLLAMRTATLHVALNGAEDDEGRPHGLDYTIEHLIQEELVAHVEQDGNQNQTETDGGSNESPMEVATEQNGGENSEDNTDGHHESVVSETNDPMHQTGNPDGQPQDVASQDSEEPVVDVFRMEIITPTGSTRYQWEQRDGGPVVIRGLPRIRIAELNESVDPELSPASTQDSKIER